MCHEWLARLPDYATLPYSWRILGSFAFWDFGRAGPAAPLLRLSPGWRSFERNPILTADVYSRDERYLQKVIPNNAGHVQERIRLYERPTR